MISINWSLLRWTGWAVIWSINHPELHMKEAWLIQPMSAATSIALYFVSGLLVEIIYRKLVWHWIPRRKGYPAVIRPEYPEHPWISLLDQYPPENSFFEVYCADGKTRSAKSEQIVDGKVCMVIEYEGEIEKLQRGNPWRFRPTQWRNYRKQ